MGHKIITRSLVVGALVAVATTGAVGIAAAEPNNGPAGKPGVGCAVQDEHGNVTYVPVGSRYGLFHCEADGEWHFGWATTGFRGGSPAGPTATGTRTLR